jgi:hypothetical protein
MISVGDGIILMAFPTCVFGAVRDVTFQGYFIAVIIHQSDFRMGFLLRSLAQTGGKQKYKNRQHQKKYFSHHPPPHLYPDINIGPIFKKKLCIINAIVYSKV